MSRSTEPHVTCQYYNVPKLSGRVYDGYTRMRVVEWEELGENMKKNIAEYLEELMDVINEPVRECPHCSGMGVLFNKNAN